MAGEERKLGQSIKSMRSQLYGATPFSSVCFIGVGPQGATNVNTVIKPLHWSLLHLPNYQLQGALFLPGSGQAHLLPQWDQTVPSRPAQGKPVMELPAEHWGQEGLGMTSLRSIPAGFTKSLNLGVVIPYLPPSLESADQDSHISLTGIWGYSHERLSQAYARERILSLASFRTYVAVKVD